MVILGRNCVVHKHRSNVPIELHHVFPLGDGGPNVSANKISVCANGHYSIHAYLDLLRVGAVSWRVRIAFNRKVRAYAQTGWNEIQQSKS